MAMNAAIELGPHDPEVSTLLMSHHQRVSALLTETIANGQQAGEIRDDLTPEQLSKALFVFSAGLLGTSKVLSGVIETGEMVAAFLKCMSPPA